MIQRYVPPVQRRRRVARTPSRSQPAAGALRQQEEKEHPAAGGRSAAETTEAPQALTAPGDPAPPCSAGKDSDRAAICSDSTSL